MKGIHPKVLTDLEFDAVRRAAAEKTVTKPAENHLLQIVPSTYFSQVRDALKLTDEWLKSFQSGNEIPFGEFKPFAEELEKIRVAEYFLEPEILREISHTVKLLLDWKKFFKRFKEDFPVIYDYFSALDLYPEIAKEIDKVIAPDGSIKDTASPELAAIRKEINEQKRHRTEVFNNAKLRYDRLGMLDEIKESIADGQPVLAVKAAYRHQVQGNFAGVSRSGNIVFIESEESHTVTKRIRVLLSDEQNEIIRILKNLSVFLRPYTGDLHAYENFLIRMDIMRAKALLAFEMDAVLPRLSETSELKLYRAFHPLLLMEGKKSGRKVISQDIELNAERRIMVISGPNAGGKSITLKTAGLIQLMWQAGFLVPVHPDSELPFFKKILTDIGDNQSIENQLSTYSYRLKNMRLFLRLADKNTFFLIDEFGTGSDPELGGTLAEVFLEEFQKSGAFGIVTTHYNNLKMAAEKLPGVFNAHMEFDLQTLSPTYHLRTGEPGSSFTYEVAAKMGIPYSLINKAKKKTDKRKVKFDKMLADLHQRQKSLREEREQLETEREELRQQKENLAEQEFRLVKKLDAFKSLYDLENRKQAEDKKILEIFDKYRQTKDRKTFFKQIRKWLDKETVKPSANTNIPNKKLKKVKENVRKELEKADIREKLAQMEIDRMPAVPEPGDRVRVSGSTANATVESVGKHKAVLNYGKFTAEVPLKDLEIVMKKSRKK